MKLTIKELRKVYQEAFWTSVGIVPDAALLAVARYVEKRVREQEPTEEMMEAGVDAWDAHASGVRELVDLDGTLREIIKAMQRVAPSVVPEE